MFLNNLQKHFHSIQFKDADQSDCANLLGCQDLELLRTFIEVISQGDGILQMQYASILRPASERNRFRCLQHLTGCRKVNAIHIT